MISFWDKEDSLVPPKTLGTPVNKIRVVVNNITTFKEIIGAYFFEMLN